MTINGELDGLVRMSRIAEAWHSQFAGNNTTQQQRLTQFPITIIEGTTHMQFADNGTIRPQIQAHDLKPEITYSAAHAMVAADMALFITLQLGGPVSDPVTRFKTHQRLHMRLVQTKAILQPLITALQLEGYRHFYPRASSCPFTAQFSQPSVLSNCSLNNTIVGVLDTLGSFDLSQIPSVQQRRLRTTREVVFQTFTSAVYNDSGFSETTEPISALELPTALVSRQTVTNQFHCRNSTASMSANPCQTINRLSWIWAVKNSPQRTLARFEQYRQPLVIGPDLPQFNSSDFPRWLTTTLTGVADGSYSFNDTSVVVRSPVLTREINGTGLVYCKVLSPARALEWIYLDGLRARLTLSLSAA